MRRMILALICCASIAFVWISLRSQPTESLAAPLPESKADDIAKLLPSDPALEVIKRLQQGGLTDRQMDAQIESLGSYRTSPAAARALVIWINYYPDWCRPRSGSSFEKIAAGPEDRPAVRGLIAMGEFAAPFLVEGDNALFIQYRSNPIVLRGHPDRLLIGYVVEQNPKVATRAVESALQRMADSPKDADVQAACEAFIKDVVSYYHEEEREKLFPPAALKKLAKP